MEILPDIKLFLHCNITLALDSGNQINRLDKSDKLEIIRIIFYSKFMIKRILQLSIKMKLKKSNIVIAGETLF